MFGKITLPTAKDGFTDDTGKVRIDGMYVFVNDENGAIENAFVKLNDDSTISVTLPDGTSIDYCKPHYSNRNRQRRKSFERHFRYRFGQGRKELDRQN